MIVFMKHLKEALLASIIVLLCIIFLASAIINFKQLGLYSRVLIFPSLIFFYSIKVKRRDLFFSLFLLFFTVAEFLLFCAYSIDFNKIYGIKTIYLSTFFYTLAYASLFVLIISNMKIKRLIKGFPLHIIVLVLFGFYLLYALDNMLKNNGLLSVAVFEYILASIYNLVIILVLISSLLGYLYHDNKKSLSLFIACLCIVFSELVQTAYYFMEREQLLNLVYTILLSVGFLMLCVYLSFNKSKSAAMGIGQETRVWFTVKTKE